MPRILVFDVNETLLDVQALEPEFERMFGDKNALKEWFLLLLLHSEALTLSGQYFDFPDVGGAVLEMTGKSRGVNVREEDRQRVREGMLRLPAHAEAAEALGMLRAAGLRLVTLTNSSESAVAQQIRNAGLEEYFERNFSVGQVKRYKPSPEPYQLVAREMGVETFGLRLVAAHGWDVMGAMRAGCAGAFVERPGKSLFPLAERPDVVGADLKAVAKEIIRRERA